MTCRTGQPPETRECDRSQTISRFPLETSEFDRRQFEPNPRRRIAFTSFSLPSSWRYLIDTSFRDSSNRSTYSSSSLLPFLFSSTAFLPLELASESSANRTIPRIASRSRRKPFCSSRKGFQQFIFAQTLRQSYRWNSRSSSICPQADISHFDSSCDRSGGGASSRRSRRYRSESASPLRIRRYESPSDPATDSLELDFSRYPFLLLTHGCSRTSRIKPFQRHSD